MDFCLLHSTRPILKSSPQAFSSQICHRLAAPAFARRITRTHLAISLSSSRLRRLLRIHLLAVLVIPDSWGRCSVSSAFPRPHAHDLAVDGARDAVLQFEVHFGDGVVLED
jgi:hypothetical protein